MGVGVEAVVVTPLQHVDVNNCSTRGPRLVAEEAEETLEQSLPPQQRIAVGTPSEHTTKLGHKLGCI